MGRLTTTERNFLKATALVLGSILLFWVFGSMEEWLGLRARDRVARLPSETAMRVLGIPHFLIAILFLSTSRGMRRRGSWFRVLGLAALGGVLCVLFAQLGDPSGRISRLLLLLYFAVHQFRDESHFFVVNGDAPQGTDVKRLGRSMLVVPGLVAWFWIGVVLFAAAFEIGDHQRYGINTLPAPLRYAIGILPLPALAFAVRRVRRRWSGLHPGGLKGLLRAHRPLIVVSAGIIAMIVVENAALGMVFSIVTLHVTAWYVFVMHQLARRPPPAPPPPRFSWAWMRSTRAGFTFLHGGLAVLTLLGCAIAAYAFRGEPSKPLAFALLAPGAFPYWTIVHITISFVPRA